MQRWQHDRAIAHGPGGLTKLSGLPNAGSIACEPRAQEGVARLVSGGLGGIQPVAPLPAVADARMTSCYIGNISWSTHKASLGQVFSQFGHVVDVSLRQPRSKGKRAPGFAFIHFAHAHSVYAAVAAGQCLGIQVDGRWLKVASREMPQQAKLDTTNCPADEDTFPSAQDRRNSGKRS